MNLEHISGQNKQHHTLVYTLSTCGWCRKTKDLLQSLDVDFYYVDVDKLQGADSEQIRNEVKRYNSLGTYPTIVIDHGKKVIVGFKEEEIKKVFT
ncbi:MAG: glutaredoxin domain-containing protein [Candidatus Thermoplasmatota archaeon]